MQNVPEKESVKLLAEAYFREYSSLRDEHSKREEFTSQIQIYAVIAFGGLIPLIQYIESESVQGRDARILFLLAAILFCAMGWYQLDLDDRKADIDNYLLHKLTPKIETLLSTLPTLDGLETEANYIFEWQLYWRTKRYGNFAGFWLGFGVVGRTGVTILSAFSLLLYYIYTAHVLSPSSWSSISVILTLIVSFGVIWMVVTTIIIRNKLASVTRAVLTSGPTNSSIDVSEVVEELNVQE